MPPYSPQSVEKAPATRPKRLRSSRLGHLISFEAGVAPWSAQLVGTCCLLNNTFFDTLGGAVPLPMCVSDDR